MPMRIKEGVTTKIHLSRPNLTSKSIYLKDKVIQSKWWMYTVEVQELNVKIINMKYSNPTIL